MAGRVQQIFINYLQRSFNWDENQGDKLWSRRFAAADFATAATTVDVDMATFNPCLEIRGAYIWLAQNFTGGAVGTATLAVGSTSNAGKYVAAANVFSGAPVVRAGVTQVPGVFLDSTTPTNAGTVRFELVVTGANATALTTGVAQVFLALRAVKLRGVTGTG